MTLPLAFGLTASLQRQTCLCLCDAGCAALVLTFAKQGLVDTLNFSTFGHSLTFVTRRDLSLVRCEGFEDLQLGIAWHVEVLEAPLQDSYHSIKLCR